MKVSATGAVILFAVGFLLIVTGARGTYRSFWQALTAPATATPTISPVKHADETIVRR